MWGGISVVKQEVIMTFSLSEVFLKLYFWHYGGKCCLFLLRFGIASNSSPHCRLTPVHLTFYVCAAEQRWTLCGDVSAVSWAFCSPEEEEFSRLGTFICAFLFACLFGVVFIICVCLRHGKHFSHIRALIYRLLRSFPTGRVVFIWELCTISCTVVSASVTCSREPDCDTSRHKLMNIIHSENKSCISIN